MIHDHVIINADNQSDMGELLNGLAQAYATVFWAGTWKELLAVRSPSGEVLRQYGTYASDGSIYPETQELLDRHSMDSTDPQWPRKLWQHAEKGKVRTAQGQSLDQYWSHKSALKELQRFINSCSSGGYGGELLVLHSGNQILGFTAYACHDYRQALSVIDERFPTSKLLTPLIGGVVMDMSVSQLIVQQVSTPKRIGVFLDHAVSEQYRGKKLGSRLFDLRLQRLCERGAQVIVGRTMTTSPAQYRGNYLARGMRPVAAHGTTAFEQKKHYFLVKASKLTSR